MSPFLWLFFKFWPIWIVAAGVGFLLGIVFGGRRASAKIEKLEEARRTADADADKARKATDKLKKTNAKFEKQLNDLRKRSVPRDEHDAAKAQASEAEAASRKLKSERDEARHQINVLKENTVPVTELSEAKKVIAKKNDKIEQLKIDVGNVQRQLDAGPKQVIVNDLVGFSREESRKLDLTQAELNDLKKQAAESEARFSTDLATAEANAQHHKEEATKLKAERDTLRTELSKLQVDEAAAAEAHLLRERVERRDAYIAQLRSQLDDTIDELGNLKKSVADGKA